MYIKHVFYILLAVIEISLAVFVPSCADYVALKSRRLGLLLKYPDAGGGLQYLGLILSLMLPCIAMLQQLQLINICYYSSTTYSSSLRVSLIS